MGAKNKIILGTVQFGLKYGINNTTGMLEKKEVFRLFDYAYENEIRTLDAAEAYGSIHALIGEYHKNHAKFSINTKLKTLQKDPEKQINNLLAELHTDHIDTLMFHSPSDFAETGQETFEILAKLKSQGKIKNIGVSVYTNDEASNAILNDIISVIQLPFNLLDNAAKRNDVIDLLVKKKNQVHVRSIYLQGLFFKNPSEITGNLLELAPFVERIQNIARNSQISIKKLAMGYASSQTNIDKIIVGVDNIQQLESNIKEQNFTLPDNIRKSIDEIIVPNSSLLYPYNWKP